MTSQLNVDTIVDKAGSSGPSLPNTTTIKMGNTSTYVSDGGATTQNTVQGLCKCWATQIDHGGGAIDGDTFNIASFNDYATGRGRPTMTNAMGNSTYTVIATNGGSNYPYQGWVVDTNTFEASTVNASANFADGYNNAAIFGDLA